MKAFEKPYIKTGKHRKKCQVCNKLIQDGEITRFTMVTTEKYYPVKGIMTFNNWKVVHAACV